jgi:hypothetical protein
MSGTLELAQILRKLGDWLAASPAELAVPKGAWREARVEFHRGEDDMVQTEMTFSLAAEERPIPVPQFVCALSLELEKLGGEYSMWRDISVVFGPEMLPFPKSIGVGPTVKSKVTAS